MNEINKEALGYLLTCSAEERRYLCEQDFSLFFCWYFIDYCKYDFAPFHFDFFNDCHDLLNDVIRETAWIAFAPIITVLSLLPLPLTIKKFSAGRQSSNFRFTSSETLKPAA